MPRPARRLIPPAFAMIAALLVTTLVAGCQIGQNGLGQTGAGAATDDAVTPNAVAGDAIEVVALDAPVADAGLADAEALAQAPEPGAADGPAPLQTADPAGDAAAEGDAEAEPASQLEAAPAEAAPVVAAPPKLAQQIACEKRGGSWSGVGSGVLRTCVMETRDGGKSCQREGDCEGMCLARSRTCAPIEPLLGCNEILQDNGARVTLCIE